MELRELSAEGALRQLRVARDTDVALADTWELAPESLRLSLRQAGLQNARSTGGS